MGLYDRDYARDDSRDSAWGGDVRGVTALIVANGVVFLLDMLQRGAISSALALPGDALTRPIEWWRFLGYGFVHDQRDIGHILFNMISLWVFGRWAEDKLGRRELLTLYVLSVVFSGVVWSGAKLALSQTQSSAIGASGAVSAILVYGACSNPRTIIRLFFVLEVPAWLACLILLGLDLSGMLRPTSRIAHEAHLGGMAFAFAYWYFGWNFSQWVPRDVFSFFRRRGKFRPAGTRLRVHSPPPEAEDEISRRADRVLAKITSEGEASLTDKERQILEEYSRRLQRRRQ